MVTEYLLDPVALESMIESSGGVAVSFGTQETFGHLDEPGEIAFDELGSVVGTDRFVRVPTGKLTGLTVEAAITVDGTSYLIREHLPVDDGAITQIWLMAP